MWQLSSIVTDVFRGCFVVNCLVSLMKWVKGWSPFPLKFWSSIHYYVDWCFSHSCDVSIIYVKFYSPFCKKNKFHSSSFFCFISFRYTIFHSFPLFLYLFILFCICCNCIFFGCNSIVTVGHKSDSKFWNVRSLTHLHPIQPHNWICLETKKHTRHLKF